MKFLIWGIGAASWQSVIIAGEENIIGYIDTFSNRKEFGSKKVYKPFEISNIEFDAILVSTRSGESVLNSAIQYNVDVSKLVFVCGNASLADLNKDYSFVASVLGDSVANSIRYQNHLITDISFENRKGKRKLEISEMRDELYYKNDYARLKTLELLIDEIVTNEIKGNLAEFGVFRGDFSKFINAAFPDRKLYLFDTFEGFPDDELEHEMSGELKETLKNSFSNTSVDIVMNNMPNKDSVVIKKGFFPASLNGLEDIFSLVSIDCDWEESIYQGLVYFYPRLAHGGYILLHDYNNYHLCAKRAIKRYEEIIGQKICRVPICDNQGSVIILK